MAPASHSPARAPYDDDIALLDGLRIFIRVVNQTEDRDGRCSRVLDLEECEERVVTLAVGQWPGGVSWSAPLREGAVQSVQIHRLPVPLHENLQPRLPFLPIREYRVARAPLLVLIEQSLPFA